MTEDRVPMCQIEDRCPLPDGHKGPHEWGGPPGWKDRVMTEDRVPTQSLDDTLRAWGLDPASFIESLTGWGYEIRRSEQPAPPHRFVAAYFGDPDRDPACGICRRPFVEHREQPAPPLDVEQVVNQIRQRIVQRTNVEEWGRDALIEYGVVMDILDEVARDD